MRAVIAVCAFALVLAGSAGTAAAYPQYQISKDQTCASCHISPAGGGLLNGYGELTAEEESLWGGNPGFLHGVLELPDMLRVGGDLRAAAGAHSRGDGVESAIFPMQSELYAFVEKSNIGLYAIGGATVEGAAGDARSFVPFSREHWLMWRQGEGDGLYVRAGRFMPVQGLRQAEHVFYTRRFGGTPLFSEVYGANFGWLKPDLEAHASIFIADPLVDSIERGDGAAVYVEKRFAEGSTAIGLLDRFTTSDTDTRWHTGVTAKRRLSDKLLLAAEVQVIRQNFKLAAPTRFQLVGNVLATYFVRPGLFVNVGLGHYDEDVSIAELDRDALDVNIHFFAISHLELVLMNRIQMIAFGAGGDSSGYSLLQLHYRI
ncbi:MAG: hypothetical protein F9K40_07295 [Kofleriaceae bacterium]|nr:MAG: hypothetical protein F9K40_07295 [Kofleriaceae bacterium]MBZ0234312.1 hypothetical protein [Kofleriaceae bacterium]